MAFTKEAPKKQSGFLFRYSLQSLGLIAVIAFLLRAFLFSSYVMSGASMLPSIWPGDFLIGSKLRLGDLKRGDVVALRCPQAKDKLCLKRVVGLPGDRVEFREGALVLNGQQARYSPAGVFATESVGAQSRPVWPDAQSREAISPVVVHPKELYLLNDKRSERDDSRTWGPVTQSLLEAKIIRVWMSLDWYDGERVRAWPRVRRERLLRSID